MDIKEIIKEKIENSFMDMSSHSYNEYTKDSERTIELTVDEMEELYVELGGDVEDLSIV